MNNIQPYEESLTQKNIDTTLSKDNILSAKREKNLHTYTIKKEAEIAELLYIELKEQPLTKLHLHEEYSYIFRVALDELVKNISKHGILSPMHQAQVSISREAPFTLVTVSNFFQKEIQNNASILPSLASLTSFIDALNSKNLVMLQKDWETTINHPRDGDQSGLGLLMIERFAKHAAADKGFHQDKVLSYHVGEKEGLDYLTLSAKLYMPDLPEEDISE